MESVVTWPKRAGSGLIDWNRPFITKKCSPHLRPTFRLQIESKSLALSFVQVSRLVIKLNQCHRVDFEEFFGGEIVAAKRAADSLGQSDFYRFQLKSHLGRHILTDTHHHRPADWPQE